MLTFESLLTIERFAHKSLWPKGEPVWSALRYLKDYLNKNNPQRIEIDIPEGVFLKNQETISIGTGTIIEPGVMIQGPCIIGKNCFIAHSAYLRGNIITGDHCHIGHATELKGSILLDYAAATHFVYLGDSILGNHVNLGAGIKCANLRLDREEVTVFFEGRKMKTGLSKFSCVVGDHVQIGCNSVINPGTIIGRESFSYPMMNISGVVQPQSRITPEGVLPVKQRIIEKLLCNLNPPEKD